MNGMDIAMCIGEIPDELLAEAISVPQKTRRKKKIVYTCIAAVLIAAVSLGAYFGGLIPGIRTGDQCGFKQPKKEVYEIVRLEELVSAEPLYVYGVTPDEEILSAVKEKFGLEFDSAIYVFYTDKKEYKIGERYLFPVIRDGEVRLIIDARVSKRGIDLSYTHLLNDFLNTVSNLTDENSPGYIVVDNETIFCIAGDKAYCTECIWDELEYVGDIAIPKRDVSVIRVN
jgi:hypothetical protein